MWFKVAIEELFFKAYSSFWYISTVTPMCYAVKAMNPLFLIDEKFKEKNKLALLLSFFVNTTPG